MYSSLNIYNQPVTLAPTTVASPNAAYQRMANFWGLVEDLKEGTYKIRSEHRKYLPQEPRETDDAYDDKVGKVNSSAIFAAYRENVKRYVGQKTYQT